MPKDSQYWKVHNQKRKEYLSQKKRESRAKLKEMVVDQKQRRVVDHASVVDRVPVVDTTLVVDRSKVVDRLAVVDTSRVVDHPILTKLIQQWQTATNYNCPPTCLYSYCSNCWYFKENKLVDYKGGKAYM